MDHGSAVKKITESKPEGSWRMERPRLRWLQAVNPFQPELISVNRKNKFHVNCV